jgi:hypothetical protein
MKLHLTQALIDVDADVDVARAVEIRVSGRRVATLAPEPFAEPHPGTTSVTVPPRDPLHYRLPPAFAATLAGTGDLALHYADTGALVDRARVEAGGSR